MRVVHVAEIAILHQLGFEGWGRLRRNLEDSARPIDPASARCAEYVTSSVQNHAAVR